MIDWVITAAHDWLARHGLWGYLRVFTYLEFRAVCSLLLSFVLVLLLGQRTIRWLLRMKIGDRPEFYNAELNQLMKQKANTPTMGGVLIVGAITVSTLLLADLTSFYVQMALLCLLWMAAVGMWDDWLKLTSSRRGGARREGLYFWEKLMYQVGLAVLLGLFIHHYAYIKPQTSQPLYAHLPAMSHALNLPFLKTWVWDAYSKGFVPSPNLLTLGAGAFVVLSVLVIVGSSNAVNLTDGMDGLASGIMSIVAFAFMILALIAGDDVRAKFLLVPYIPLSDELAVVAGAMVGASLAFLWFNCSPARGVHGRHRFAGPGRVDRLHRQWSSARNSCC